MTNNQITEVLAERILGWRSAPGRFLTGGRRWIPNWRFQPLKRLDDALRLLEALNPDKYTIQALHGRGYFVQVVLDGKAAEHQDPFLPRSISLCVAAAVGIEIGNRTSIRGRS